MKRDKNFKWSRADAARPDLNGLKISIVGGTGGIGRAFSRLLASRGASVLVVGQNFRDADMPGIEFIKADLSLMREAQRVARLLPASDARCANARCDVRPRNSRAIRFLIRRAVSMRVDRSGRRWSC